ncbi:MAG TPA: PAS domain S-box protein, partial [Thermoanaerobaculia bacterium]
RSSEERYRGLVEDASEAIFRLGPDGQILSANPASTRMTGWSEEELLAMDFRTIVHPDDLARGQETVRATLAGTRGKAVFRLFRKDGSIAYVDTTTVPERQNGQVAAVFGIGRDISATRAANDRLAERERLLSAVLDQLPVGVVVSDRNGKIIRSNAVADQIWAGHRTYTALATKEYRGWRADTGQRLQQQDWASARALLHGEVTDRELLDIEAFDGTRKTILNSAAPLRDAEGKIEGVVIVNQDVTEQRETMREREALAVRLRQVIVSANDGICTVDPDGQLTLVNPAAAAMLGYDEAEMIGRDFHTLVHAEDVADGHSVRDVMRLREARPLFSTRFRHRSGAFFDVEVSCAPMVVEDAVIGAVIAFRDVTRRNAIERELERNRRLSSLGQLAATIAHEFNNVMMGIMPFLDVILRRAGDDDTLQPMAGHVKNALRRAKQITSEVLKFTQTSQPELRAVGLAELLQSAESELRAIAGPLVDVRIAPVADDVAAAMDRTLMLQVLSNLVANARDAMLGRGVIEIESAVASAEERSRLPQANPGEYVRISIKDYGAGIDEKIMQRMFEPLFTTKHAGGTGLGLAVVQQIMSKHDGVITTESVVGEGTTFRLYLRRCDPPAPDTTIDAQKAAKQIRKVVIIEDDESVSAGLIAILTLEDVEVHAVALGRDALPAIESFEPDAVLLDRGLPDADGVDVCRAILARWPHMPIVFSTGHGSRTDLEEMLGRPNVGFLLKPYDIDTLLELLHRVVQH